MTATAAQLNDALAGRYRIDREIGRGGMATVYLAEDLRHQRNVAVKVLDPELGAVLGVERFLAEIRVTANLQHPNLLPLFDSGEANGLLYYVMPFVSGESLRVRIAREKQLPIDDAVRIALAVAGALDYAHRNGVIHRDLKPENILLHEGQPLVADFGIALAVSRAGGTRVTQTGISLGTPQYMSPEQATGDRQIDGRSDIYSLGAVLYEMLAGEPPFTGATTHNLIAKVLTDSPRAPRLTRPTIPPRVEAVTLKALAKLPADRFQTANDFAAAMQGDPVAIPEGVSTPGSIPSAGRPGARARLGDPLVLTLVALLVAATGAAGWLASQRSSASDSGDVTRTALALPAEMPITGSGGRAIAISPDGRTIAYSGLFVEGGMNIFIRRLSELQPRALPGMMLALDPSISPDGRWIAYAAGSQLYKIGLSGGPALLIGEGQTLGTTWVGNDTIAGVRNSRIWLYPADGGAGRPLMRDSVANERLQSYPLASPDGKLVFYQAFTGGATAATRISVASVETGLSAQLAIMGVAAIGMVDDALIYARADGAVLAVRIDPRELRVIGEPIPLGEQVTVVAGNVARAAMSPTGTLIYQAGATVGQLVFMDFTGGGRRTVDQPRTFLQPRLSPDGGRLAVSYDGDIWIYDLASDTPTRLTTAGRNDRPEWSADGARVIFRTTRDGADQVWWQPADGSGPAERLHMGAQEAVASSDGKWLVVRIVTSTGTKRDIRYRALVGDTTTRPIAESEFEELMPRLSPDDRWIAYVSDESGRLEVYVRAFPGPSGKVQISTGGGTEPVWSRDGRQIFYRSGRAIMSARLSLAPAPSVVERRKLLEGTFSSSPIHANYDVTRDGRGFVMIEPNTGAQVIVVQNWARDVRARLRAAR